MKLFKHCFVILVLTAVVSCSTEPAPKYYGSIYFGAGSYLGKFDLREGGSSIVASVGNANIRQVNALHGSRLLIVVDAFENDREVARISWLDTRTLQTTALFAGVAAAWVSDVHTYVYDDGSRLAAASTHRDFETDTVIMNHRIDDVSRITVISGASILFQTGFRDLGSVWRYDVDTAELRELESLTTLCLLQDSVWIADKQRLACRSRASGEYVLVTLDGVVTDRLALPEGRNFSAVTYVPDQRLIVFSEAWRRELGGKRQNAVWVHELDSGNSTRLVEHQHLGDSAVYRPD